MQLAEKLDWEGLIAVLHVCLQNRCIFLCALEYNYEMVKNVTVY